MLYYSISSGLQGTWSIKCSVSRLNTIFSTHTNTFMWVAVIFVIFIGQILRTGHYFPNPLGPPPQHSVKLVVSLWVETNGACSSDSSAATHKLNFQQWACTCWVVIATIPTLQVLAGDGLMAGHINKTLPTFPVIIPTDVPDCPV